MKKVKISTIFTIIILLMALMGLIEQLFPN